MASSFFELSVASTGLFTTKSALNVVNHNIANADTIGYSRQIASIKARTPLNYQNGRGMIGTGSEVVGIGQIRNFYLDTKYWTNMGILGEYSAKNAQNQLLQATFNETDTTGFNASLNNLFTTLGRDLVTDSGNTTPRLSVIESAQALAKYFNQEAAALERQQNDINQEVKGVVSQINNLGVQIQNLNKQIFASEIGGQTANDLRDERALLVDELSRYVNVEVKEVEVNKDLLTGKSDKRFQVSINGYDFVNHFDMNPLSCVERTVKNNAEDIDGLYDIYWSSGIKFNSEFSLDSMSGELKGLLEVRDGNNKNFPIAKVADAVTNTTTGGVTLTLDGWSREDMPLSGKITIGGKTYSYDNYTYDEATNKMTIDIPPASGKMTVGSRVISYSGLQLNVPNPGDISFKLEEPITQDEIRNKIKIGDMELARNNYDLGDGRNIVLKQSSTAANIGNLTTMVGADVKIGTSVDHKGIPYFMERLNEFARGIARSFNLGQDVHGNKLEGVTGHYYAYNLIDGDDTGYNFFTYNDGFSAVTGKGIENFDYHNITAKNFSVSKELLENPNALAAALTANPGVSDNTFLLQLVGLKHNPNVFDQGEYGNYIQSIIGELGIVSYQSVTFESNYTDITSSIQNQRLSVSSVDLNEEMTNMMELQQIYNACAKMIATLNGIYDTTINKLGI